MKSRGPSISQVHWGDDLFIQFYACGPSSFTRIYALNEEKYEAMLDGRVRPDGSIVKNG